METKPKPHRISKEVREQILKRIKEEGITVAQTSEERGVSTQAIYSWLGKGITKQPSWMEMAKLKEQNRNFWLSLVKSP